MGSGHSFVKTMREKKSLFSLSAGCILSAFYYGYIVMQIPGGFLARKFGGATVLGVTIGSSGALTLLTPLAARTHVGMLIALRVAMGLCEVNKYACVVILLLKTIVVAVVVVVAWNGFQLSVEFCTDMLQFCFPTFRNWP